MKLRNDVIQLVKETGKSTIFFQDYIRIKMTPHTPPVNLWAVAIEPVIDNPGRIAVMDSDENWFEVEDKDENIINTLFQRLSLMKNLKNEISRPGQ